MDQLVVTVGVSPPPNTPKTPKRPMPRLLYQELTGEPDIVVEERVIVEVKAVRSLHDKHTAQLLNYLKATGIRVGLLVNFGAPKLQLKRYVFGSTDSVSSGAPGKDWTVSWDERSPSCELLVRHVANGAACPSG